NQAPKAESIRRMTVAVHVGDYNYARLKPETAAVPGIVAQARAALQIAAGAEADRLAESEYRLARIALGTVEEMLSRSAPPEVISSYANESIRRSQRSLVAAKEAAARLEQRIQQIPTPAR